MIDVATLYGLLTAFSLVTPVGGLDPCPEFTRPPGWWKPMALFTTGDYRGDPPQVGRAIEALKASRRRDAVRLLSEAGSLPFDPRTQPSGYGLTIMHAREAAWQLQGCPHTRTVDEVERILGKH